MAYIPGIHLSIIFSQREDLPQLLQQAGWVLLSHTHQTTLPVGGDTYCWTLSQASQYHLLLLFRFFIFNFILYKPINTEEKNPPLFFFYFETMFHISLSGLELTM